MRKAQLRVPKQDTYVGHNLAVKTLRVQETHRPILQCTELCASVSKEGEDKGLWTLLGEISQDGRADLKARSFRKGQGDLLHSSPVSAPSSCTSSSTCLRSHRTGRTSSFFSLCWFSPLSVTFSSSWGHAKPTLTQGKWQEHCSWRQEAGMESLLPAAASC